MRIGNCNCCKEEDVELVEHDKLFGWVCQWCFYELEDIETEASRHRE